MKPKRPRDPIQLAKAIGDIATGQIADADPDAGKNPAAVELGRKGGSKGGAIRAATLSAAQRASIAKKAAMARWGNVKNRQGATLAPARKRKAKVSV